MSTSSVMGTLKKLLVAALAGFGVGVVLATLLAPSALTRYHTPGGAQAMCNCADLVTATTSQLIKGQLVGGLVGAVTAIGLGIVMMRRAEKKASAMVAAQAAAAQPPPAAPPPKDG